MISNKCLKYGFLNAGFLGTSHDEFILAMHKHCVDIMAINETWLRPGEEGRAPKVEGYKFRHIPRPLSVRGGRGGGVAFYIKTGIQAKIRPHSDNKDVEQLWMSLKLNDKTILIGTAYRPLWLDLDTFFNGVCESAIALAPYENIMATLMLIYQTKILINLEDLKVSLII